MVLYKKILRILPVIMLGLFLALSPPSKASAAGSDLHGTAGGGSGANTYLFYYEFDGRGVRLRVATTGGWPIDEFGGQTGHTFTKGDHTYIPASHPVCASAIDGPLAQMCATYGLNITDVRNQLGDAGYANNAGVWVAPGPTYLTYIDPFDGIGAAPQHQHTWTDWAPLNSEYHEKHTTCGHYMQMIERHQFTPYVDQHDGTHTRVCPICGYTQNAPHDMAIVSKNIQTHTEGWRRVITADVVMHCRYCEHEERAHTELSVSGAEAETWTGIGSYRLSSDCGAGSSVVKNSVYTVGSLGTFGGNKASYTQYKEGRYTFYYTLGLSSKCTIQLHLGTFLVDHTPPQITVTLTPGGTSRPWTEGFPKQEPLTWTESSASVESDIVVEEAEMRWSNQSPTITIKATDFLKNSKEVGAGVGAVYLYDDKGNSLHLMNRGNDTYYYGFPQLGPRYEGTHRFSIVVYDKLQRNAFHWRVGPYGESFVDPREAYVGTDYYYDRGKSEAYDINHITPTKFITHLDFTPPVVTNLNNSPDVNFIENSVINFQMTDFPQDASTEEIPVNDTSDVAYIELVGTKPDGNMEVVARAERVNDDKFIIVPPQETFNASMPGSAFSVTATCVLFYGGEDRILVSPSEILSGTPVPEARTETRDSSMRLNIYLDAGRTNGLSSAEYESYSIHAFDRAGNGWTKNEHTKAALLHTIHTTIDPSSYW